MKQVLLSLFFIMILGFGITGYSQTLDDDEGKADDNGNMAEQDSQTVITDKM
ncbi:hypothetical protein GCM10028778_23800 [Barrientosiimonas marina]|uniref:Uncharacterized protein n=1 Tax=Lentibacillus kimchii TaxID=1542911 RepID=A0ABW2UVJ3_9BACI